MGEIAINPQHNVFKQYRKVNYINPYVFTPVATYNTYIGGVSGTIFTASLLATKLGISVGAISNFEVVGSDIKCKITGNYTIPIAAFADSNITYYTDIENKISNLSASVYSGCYSFYEFKSDGLTTITGSNVFYATPILKEIYLPILTSCGNECFRNLSGQPKKNIYIPLCTSLGSTSGNNGVFENINKDSYIYCNPSLSTNNGGAPDGDIAYAITQGSTVRYVTNFTAPSPITTLAAGTIYNTSIQLNFTAPSSTNAIDYYDLYFNGVLQSQRITASGQYITGLTASTSYNITLIAVDIFYNKSVVSNTLSISTTSDLSDTDAAAYTTASSNSAYQYAINDLFKGLKDNSLYTKIPAFYPNIGTAAQQKYNGKNPLDTDGAYRLTYGGTSTFNDLGFQPNGSNGYANTHLNLSALSLTGNFTFGYFINVATTIFGDKHGIGAYSSGNNWTGLQHNTSTQLLGMAYGGGGTSLTITTPNIGFFAMTVNGTSKKVYQRDLSATGTTNGTGLANLNIYIGALNLNNTYYGGLNARYGFTFISEYLNDTEISNLKLIVDIFEFNIGRKTW